MHDDVHVTLLCGCEVFLDGKQVVPAEPCSCLREQKLKVLRADSRDAFDEADALRDEIAQHYAQLGFQLYVPPRQSSPV